ncbi:MAG: YbaB/EbfC family nucleoid-associated protein [Myxococcales bacterium]|nr:YbaB/EbfC family nucleoid-associated protein [Myxococcales bacterium]
MQMRGGMNEVLRQAARLQRKIEETKAAFSSQTLEVTGANDKVKVTASLAREVVRIEIDPAFLAEDREFALDAAVGTINAALKKASDAMEAELNKVTGGVKIPGVL